MEGQRKTWRLSDKMMRRWWNAGNAVKDTMLCNAVKLLSAIYPGAWAAASLTAETGGALLCICVRSHILACIIYIFRLLIQPPWTSHHNYSRRVAGRRHWRLQNVTQPKRGHQSAGLSPVKGAAVRVLTPRIAFGETSVTIIPVVAQSQWSTVSFWVITRVMKCPGKHHWCTCSCTVSESHLNAPFIDLFRSNLFLKYEFLFAVDRGLSYLPVEH